ncbi:uncharacterized protein SPPG_06051 [Spizellomyces punctatus DAOM BR117]|uniref:Uncharacterized protein n=1 Tax=Spizellomyces punctatus (strain DAOM BR117) TaxID=645134 RepID=A0A0L0HC41_SPIPD|nr:uncharacterized protein SPPG_06051 [Spizellomyces punctatus DAOM BR117]KNC98343.1 hypothetical protein SPPG_06051 [Spizellomyces punctatus DAOM BR117]|eukprot:XP_016606383.1 hypothetical protein SPPG_06051 [Spizellomyces punctatus DAOM BR117]
MFSNPCHALRQRYPGRSIQIADLAMEHVGAQVDPFFFFRLEAALHGQAAIESYFLEIGANVDGSCEGYSALASEEEPAISGAGKGGHMEVMHILLAAGAFIILSLTIRPEQTAIHLACSSSNPEAIRLMRHWKTLAFEALQEAKSHGTPAVEALLEGSDRPFQFCDGSLLMPSQQTIPSIFRKTTSGLWHAVHSAWADILALVLDTCHGNLAKEGPVAKGLQMTSSELLVGNDY